MAQSKFQSVSGIVIDKLSKQPLNGASLSIRETKQGINTDSLGNFTIPKINIGRHSITCSFSGYEQYRTEEFIVSSVRPVILLIELKQKSIDLEQVNITSQNTNVPINDLAFVSARSFTAEETERIPASINDPGRMALAYPGVKQGRDESENKILIRGNSPFGILWRLEGIDIPSPNHFAMPGAGGAGVTVFSAQLLSRSDFFTGGMPAEYGNTISGAFDIHFREGNKQIRNYRLKAGLVGIDLSTEGPIKNGRSSYLINYRYSTLGLLSQMGFYLAGERTVNYFQDLSFNLAFHGKSGKSTTTIFGIGGFSNEHHELVKNPNERVSGKSDHWEDRYKPANLGAYGVTHTVSINERSSIKYVFALTGSNIQRKYDTLNLENVRFRYNTQLYKESRIAASIAYSYRLPSRTRFKTGTILNYIHFDFSKEITPRNTSSEINHLLPQTSVSGKGNTQTAQAYATLVHELGKGLTVQTGFHCMYLFLNHSSSIEPRISIQYKMPIAHSISFAYGLYSQLLPMSAYFYTRKDTIAGQLIQFKPNSNLNFPRSNHLILNYNHITKNEWKITAEAYYQFLKKVPVESRSGSTYYMLNQSDGFPETPSVSKGKGKNMGIDAGIEKLFLRKYYVLLTASVFKSQFKTLTNKYLNSAFNDKFSTAFTLGREFSFKNGSVLQVGAKSLYNGGFPYMPLDVSQSTINHQYIAVSNSGYSINAPNYFRIDGRISFRTNHKKYASVLSLDIQNVTNKINITSIQYNQVTNALEQRRSGSGLVPVVSYQLDF